MKKSAGKPPRNRRVRMMVVSILVVSGSLLVDHFFTSAWYFSWRSWLLLVTGSIAFALLGEACATWIETTQQRKRESP